ncbi:hypothetical protein [Mycobacteroides abscessus]|uniref:hypothetical protein n=1 Tax=Mycobacteroides abscessus TaxID=36809 RepID=UPI0002683D07|nr:hypothetical protein [Mycobacteroides abscessus]EIV21056.1 hypothetical protein MA3A0119R_4777 [Mycobacteroides abscessus 3A-0119-R]EIV23977.1 hypothetical protein MA3A0122R_4876 [Mycobacteroides abscessus 3A-0122-R]EIV31693.1 hypothetical protein MA3A0122S_4630 [Mycobacteroides abscessus 3A-0122-S]EIV35131.1 hypothetical protein MA3A0731_4867 [Mycobacteroides abscessus 3A-0731]EIV44521.1 hypothetical protein MA3A0930R_4789 [Mycobacteroides abscessus 3A-0930-R]
MTQETGRTRKGKTSTIAAAALAASRAGFAVVIESSKDDLHKLTHERHINQSHENRGI